jgi:hypothetical protein
MQRRVRLAVDFAHSQLLDGQLANVDLVSDRLMILSQYDFCLRYCAAAERPFVSKLFS